MNTFSYVLFAALSRLCASQVGTAQGVSDPEPTSESRMSPMATQKEEESKKIIDGQYKCFEKMHRDQPYNRSGSEHSHCVFVAHLTQAKKCYT